MYVKVFPVQLDLPDRSKLICLYLIRKKYKVDHYQHSCLQEPKQDAQSLHTLGRNNVSTTTQLFFIPSLFLAELNYTENLIEVARVIFLWYPLSVSLLLKYLQH